jgi:hypothetical protein
MNNCMMAIMANWTQSGICTTALYTEALNSLVKMYITSDNIALHKDKLYN